MMMKQGKVHFYSTLAVSLLLGCTIVLFGCSTELGLNPEVESGTPSSMAATTDSGAGRGVPASALKFIELPCSKGRDAVAYGGCSAEVVVPRETGVKFVLPCAHGDVEVRTGLLVGPYSIVAPSSPTAADNSEDVTVSLNVSWDRLITDVNLVFGPHGTIFDPPAAFVLKVTGLDLSSYDVYGDLGFYYYNENADLWELQDAAINVDEVQGNISVKTKLHHFSRYAVAFAN